MKHISLIIASVLMLASCCQVVSTQVNVIPQPADVEVYDGELNIAGASFKADAALGEMALNAVSNFAEKLASASTVATGTGKSKFVFKYDAELDKEGYSISAYCRKVIIEASSLNGVLFALETIKQMLPVEIYTGAGAADAAWVLPYMKIDDEPCFGYRGLHLDVSRHFFDVNEIKKYIDIMAIHKLNILHWHLTDDQGWRIEIKKYPELTQVGSVRKETLVGHQREKKKVYDNTPYGGWYSQEQISDIIAYAAAKGIEIIPEIDLPGHMVAALATYPELGCTGNKYDVRTQWGISTEVLCAGKESTLLFLEDVLAEVCELFPCEYVHIGGDECPKGQWKECPRCQAKIQELGLKGDEKHSAEHYLQSYVTKRMETFLASKGKKLIGWDEILEGELAPNATVMSWRNIKAGQDAARMGHDAIMTPRQHFYFDYYQSKDRDNEPLGIGGFLPVEQVYAFEPYAEDMTDEDKSHIIGVQANLWTEYIGENWHLEYMLLPRLSALSEVQWCEPENKNYERFLKNVKGLRKVYEILDYNYAKHIFE